ncbi:MAG TPA: fibronectin type III domain-containing protein [Planctomycetota bacterium]|nr:fibronectin type III domain-containing protein [Planctomycetota bacterium]
MVAPTVIGPVCGSGRGDVTMTDTAVTNGTGYTYSVVTVNHLGTSVASQPSTRAMPMTTAASAAPAAPAQVTIAESGDHVVTLRWRAVPGAAQYTVTRSTMQADERGGFDPISAIRLATVTGDTFTDRTASNGRVYTYLVTAENAIGVSAASAPVQAMPVASAPTTAPTELASKWKDFRGGTGIVLTWKAVPGATGYVIYRSDSATATFAWPTEFRTALLETTFFDQGNTDKRAKVKGLDPTKDYSYQISAVTSGGVSPAAVLRVPAKTKP